MWRFLFVAFLIAHGGIRLAIWATPVNGVGLWAHADWWQPVAVVGPAGSLGLMVLFLNPWFLFVEAVNAALIVSLVWLDWPSTAMVGA